MLRDGSIEWNEGCGEATYMESAMRRSSRSITKSCRTYERATYDVVKCLREAPAHSTAREAPEHSTARGQHESSARTSHKARCADVHRRLKKIAAARGGLDLAEAAALREAQQLMMWRALGYGSLLEYMEMELGYAPKVAKERLRVAHALVELPLIAGALERGERSYSAVRELTRVATAEIEEEWLTSTKDKNLRTIEAMVSGRQRGQRPTDPPDPRLKTQVIRLELRPEAYAQWRQLRRVIEQEKGELLEDSQLVEALFRALNDRSGDGKSSTPAYQIAVTVCESCNRGWQDGDGVVVEMTPAAVERAQCDAVHVGSIDGSETSRPTRTIPAATRRKVLRRDHGRCCVPWCRSSRNVDVHHLVEWARGGTHDVENLVCLCEAHHLALHEGTLLVIRRDGKLVFERAALHDVGSEESSASSATLNDDRSHVGPRASEPQGPCESSTSPAKATGVGARAKEPCGPGESIVSSAMLKDDRPHVGPRASEPCGPGESSTSSASSTDVRPHAEREELARQTELALVTLGFRKTEARRAVSRMRLAVGSADVPLAEWIRLALGHCPRPTTG